jgi:anti-anti-sigma factor
MHSEIVEDMLVFSFNERLDTMAAMSLQKEITDVIAAADKSLAVRFDFAGVEYIASGFLRIVMVVLRMKGRDFSIVNVGMPVRKILEMSKLDQLIKMD